MSGHLELALVRSSGQTLVHQAREVTVPAAGGRAQILPGHLPYVALLASGALTFTDLDGKVHGAWLRDGVLEHQDNRVVVISDTLVFPADQNLSEVEAELQKVRAELQKACRESLPEGGLDALLLRERELAEQIALIRTHG